MSILSNAIDYLTEHGWTQGHLRDEDGRVCARGAIVGGNPGISREELRDTEVLILEAIGLPCVFLMGSDRLPQWNDLVARDVDEVIAAMTAADQLWAERHPSARVVAPVDGTGLDRVGDDAQHVGKAGRATFRFLTAHRQRAVAVEGDREHDHSRVTARVHA